MAKSIDSVKKLTVGTAAQDLDVGCREFLIYNLSAGTVYFKEKFEDNKAATAANGFAVPPQTLLQVPLSARTLSLIGSEAGLDVRVLFLF